MRSSVSFSADSAAGTALFKWWSDLQNNHAERAEFRRCQDGVSVVFVPGFHRLYYSLAPHLGPDGDWRNRLAGIAGVASHIKTCSTDTHLARQMRDGGLSNLRFRRLLQRERDELMVPIIRVLGILKGQANLYDLAQSMYYWGDRVRRDWSYAYYDRTDIKEEK